MVGLSYCAPYMSSLNPSKTLNIDESLGTLDDAILEKQENDDDNNIILIAKDGESKLDDILEYNTIPEWDSVGLLIFN